MNQRELSPLDRCVPTGDPVLLVGAGPGDPDLLTVAAVRALSEAEVVVHDRLVSPAILALARPTARLIDVGKHKGGGVCQEQINALLVTHARLGRRVVRLKGGDPLLFGRGGEEALALAAAGIGCRIVPGVSSALAAPAAAGIPVTHRGIANACTIISGHVLADYPWPVLAQMPGTLVVLMAATTAAEVAGALLGNGAPPEGPVAIVHAASTPNQVVHRTTLGHIASGRCPLASPSVLVIGDVAALDLALEPTLLSAGQ